MIERKKKLCAGPCDDMQYIWTKGMCQKCYVMSKPKKAIAPRSEKRKKANVIYLKARLEYLNEHQICEAKKICNGASATEIHHKIGKIGELLYDKNFFLATCRKCHDWVEANVTEAKKLGLSESRLKTTNDEETDNN